jgi:hypothetical protein
MAVPQQMTPLPARPILGENIKDRRNARGPGFHTDLQTRQGLDINSRGEQKPRLPVIFCVRAEFLA